MKKQSFDVFKEVVGVISTDIEEKRQFSIRIGSLYVNEEK